MSLLMTAQYLLDKTRALDFLAPLALRLYLAPVFWLASMNKVRNFEDTVNWFGNPEWGLGLPFPWLLALLATASEVVGAIALLVGLAVRWMAVPLMATMLAAAFTVHWAHGWQTIADPMFCLFNCGDAQEAAARLDQAREILKEHGNYEWLTGQGRFVVLNNGIQMAATYFIMLLSLFFTGAGRYVSADHWVARWSAGRQTS